VLVSILHDRVVVHGSAGLTLSVPGEGSITLATRRLELRRRDGGWSPASRTEPAG
jgi:hypothetical protein